MAKKDIGTRFQDDTQDALKALRKTGLLRFIRLYDTKSARMKYLPPQAGDFIVSARSRGHLLECKASEVHASLAECVSSHVQPHQAAEARLWARSGNPSWFLFYSQPEQKLEVWEGLRIGEAYAGLAKPGEPYLCCSSASLQDLLQGKRRLHRP